LFICQKAFEEQVTGMKTTRAYVAIVGMTLALVAQPAIANNKDKTKRAEPQPSCTDCCRPVVKPMSETTPARKNECVKVRRILM
jgi:hypothetical protein